MERDIVKKVQDALARPISSEMQVVYVLTEVRKLLELEQIPRKEVREVPDDRYAALKFYCDWAVHARMTHEGARRIVQRFDQYQGLMEELDSKHEDKGTTNLAFLGELDADLQLSKFRSQLGDYLSSRDLDHAISTDGRRWVEFLTYYSEVVQDAPLVYETGGLEFVNRVTVKVLDKQSPDGACEYILALDWTWVSNKTGMETHIVRRF